MSLILSIVAIFGIEQDASRSVKLAHFGAPSSIEINAKVDCDSRRPVTIGFKATSRGVELTSPRYPGIGEIEQDLTESRWRLVDIGRLQQWKVICRGNDSLLVFRGYNRGERPADTIVFEIVDSMIAGSLDPAIVQHFLSAE